MQITNQKPVDLSPVYKLLLSGPFDPAKILDEMIAAPLFTPVVAGTPAVIATSNGHKIDRDEVVQNVIACCRDTVDVQAETWCKTLFGKTLLHFDAGTPIRVQELFLAQAAKAANMPMPSTTCVYHVVTDVIQPCKEFLAGNTTPEALFAGFAFTLHPQTLGFYFANEVAFDGFKAYLDAQTQPLRPSFPSETNQMLSDFINNIRLGGLTESLLLRNDDGDNNHDFSFARVLVSYLMQYVGQNSPSLCGAMPFVLGELVCPRSVVFVNVEKHGRAAATDVVNEWDIINQSVQMKVQMISNNQLNKLTATVRNLKRIAGMAASAQSNTMVGAGKAANIAFKKKCPKTIDLARLIKRLLDKMSKVNRSENSYKSVKMSFSKPNRRDPDDFNKQGKVVSTKYLPDIHLYIDTSGSISEEDYEYTVRALIQMAKKLNVNMYFNSFSHVLSQCTKLRTKDRTTAQVYAEFQRVPKVSGGTEYTNVWAYIMKSKKRQREFSLMITDFEYNPPNAHVDHPANLYYAPCASLNWRTFTRSAEDFCKAMQHIDPNLRTKLLF